MNRTSCLEHPSGSRFTKKHDWQMLLFSEMHPSEDCVAELVNLFAYWHDERVSAMERGQADDLEIRASLAFIRKSLFNSYSINKITKGINYLIANKVLYKYIKGQNICYWRFKPEIINAILQLIKNDKLKNELIKNDMLSLSKMISSERFGLSKLIYHNKDTIKKESIKRKGTSKAKALQPLFLKITDDEGKSLSITKEIRKLFDKAHKDYWKPILKGDYEPINWRPIEYKQIKNLAVKLAERYAKEVSINLDEVTGENVMDKYRAYQSHFIKYASDFVKKKYFTPVAFYSKFNDIINSIMEGKVSSKKSELSPELIECNTLFKARFSRDLSNGEYTQLRKELAAGMAVKNWRYVLQFVDEYKNDEFLVNSILKRYRTHFKIKKKKVA